jgi:hypothetical protein
MQTMRCINHGIHYKEIGVEIQHDLFQESEHSFELFVHDDKNYEAKDTNVDTSPSFPVSFSSTKLHQADAVDDCQEEDGCKTDDVNEGSVKLRQRKVRSLFLL